MRTKKPSPIGIALERVNQIPYLEIPLPKTLHAFQHISRQNVPSIMDPATPLVAHQSPSPSPPNSGQSKKAIRSRSGCVECRRLHRKCDEMRPYCDNCANAGKMCSYKKTLSWGGRPFGKSSFGKVMATGVVTVEQERTSSESGKYCMLMLM